jgi:hypothetical protein
MVFTHLPSNLFLILTAFAPTIWVAFGASDPAGPSVADGRADPILLRHGGGPAGGEACRGERYRRASEARVCRRPALVRLAADGIALRLGARSRRYPEGGLRPDAAVAVLGRQAPEEC